MKRQFDPKTFILGGLIGAAIVITLGAASRPPATVGRFQTAVSENGSVVMTDTATGEVWHSMIVNPVGIRDAKFTQPKIQ